MSEDRMRVKRVYTETTLPVGPGILLRLLVPLATKEDSHGTWFLEITLRWDESGNTGEEPGGVTFTTRSIFRSDTDLGRK